MRYTTGRAEFWWVIDISPNKDSSCKLSSCVYVVVSALSHADRPWIASAGVVNKYSILSDDTLRRYIFPLLELMTIAVTPISLRFGTYSDLWKLGKFTRQTWHQTVSRHSPLVRRRHLTPATYPVPTDIHHVRYFSLDVYYPSENSRGKFPWKRLWSWSSLFV